MRPLFSSISGLNHQTHLHRINVAALPRIVCLLADPVVSSSCANRAASPIQVTSKKSKGHCSNCFKDRTGCQASAKMCLCGGRRWYKCSNRSTGRSDYGYVLDDPECNTDNLLERRHPQAICVCLFPRTNTEAEYDTFIYPLPRIPSLASLEHAGNYNVPSGIDGDRYVQLGYCGVVLFEWSAPRLDGPRSNSVANVCAKTR